MEDAKAIASVTAGGPQSDAKSRDVFFGLCGLGRKIPIRRRTIALGICGLAFLCLSRPAVAGGMLLSPLQTQSTSPPGVLRRHGLGSRNNGRHRPSRLQPVQPEAWGIDFHRHHADDQHSQRLHDGVSAARRPDDDGSRDVGDDGPERACRPGTESTADRRSDHHTLRPERYRRSSSARRRQDNRSTSCS